MDLGSVGKDQAHPASRCQLRLCLPGHLSQHPAVPHRWDRACLSQQSLLLKITFLSSTPSKSTSAQAINSFVCRAGLMPGRAVCRGCQQGGDVGALLDVPQWTATPNLIELGSLGWEGCSPLFHLLAKQLPKEDWVNNAPCALAESGPRAGHHLNPHTV